MRYCLSLLTVTGLLFAQAQFRKVDPTLTFERVIAIVPMLGTGKGKDVKRPQFSDLPGITGFTAELSDDGRYALVEFVAADRKSLDPIVNSANRLARKEDNSKDSVYEDFKRYKKNFKPERFGVAMP